MRIYCKLSFSSYAVLAMTKYDNLKRIKKQLKFFCTKGNLHYLVKEIIN